MPVKPLLVEFVGLPGAGKSTIARQLIPLLEARGISWSARPPVGPPLVTDFVSRIRHGASFFWFRFRHLSIAWQAIAYAVSVRPFELSRLRSAPHLLFLAYYLTQMRRQAQDTVVLEQSYVQTLWSTAVRGNRFDERGVSRLIANLYHPCRASLLLVRVDIDADTAAERAIARAWRGNRFDHLPVDEARNLMVLHERTLWTLLRQAADASEAPVARVHSSRNPAENAEQLAAEIERLLAADSHGGIVAGRAAQAPAAAQRERVR